MGQQISDSVTYVCSINLTPEFLQADAPVKPAVQFKEALKKDGSGRKLKRNSTRRYSMGRLSIGTNVLTVHVSEEHRRCDVRRLSMHGLNVSLKMTKSEVAKLLKCEHSSDSEGEEPCGRCDHDETGDSDEDSNANKLAKPAQVKRLGTWDPVPVAGGPVEEDKAAVVGGPLVKDPYSVEIQKLVDELAEEAEKDDKLSYNNFQYECPKLTEEQIELCEDFDFYDKTAKLPSGPLLWPYGFPEPGYVSKSNQMTGHYLQVAGIKATAKKKPSMFLRLTQQGDCCTFDASVDTFKKAKRTWKSGHYMYEPLVTGSNLMGAWAVENDHLLVGFFYDINSGLCFRIERRLIKKGKYTFLRQANEFMGRKSFVFFVRVNEDSGSTPAKLQSRDYTCLAGQDNVKNNLGDVYPCIAKDLDYPTKRDHVDNDTEENQINN